MRSSTPSDDFVASVVEREQRERELGLSAPEKKLEKKLYCWEVKDAINRAVDKARVS